ncbi:MAG: alpha/beta hydrolase [Pseudomonadota bacterium]
MAEGERPIAPFERLLATSHGAVAVADSGLAAPAILLIHGNSSCWQAFTRQFDADLAGRYRMVAFDLPGHGASADAADPERSCNIPAYADVALEVLAALGIEQAAVLGWSLGGHIGLEIMARWPGLRGLMIVGTPPVAPDPAAIARAFVASPVMEFAGREDLSPDEAETYMRAACGPTADRIPALLEAARRTDGRARRCMMNQALAGVGADGRRAAETSSTPLAVVVGADDPFVERSVLLSVDYASLWRGKVHVMEGCGHAPFLDRPAEFNELLDSFLAYISP